MSIVILIIVGFITLLSWCCCKISGETDEYFDEMFYEKNKEE